MISPTWECMGRLTAKALLWFAGVGGVGASARERNFHLSVPPMYVGVLRITTKKTLAWLLTRPCVNVKSPGNCWQRTLSRDYQGPLRKSPRCVPSADYGTEDETKPRRCENMSLWMKYHGENPGCRRCRCWWDKYWTWNFWHVQHHHIMT